MKKILPFICILLLIISCIFGILYFIEFDDEENILEVQQTTTPLRSTVESGIINSAITSTGNVINDAADIYIENIFIDFENKLDSKYFRTTHKIGDVLKKDDTLYTYKGKGIKAKYDCKIVNMIISEDLVEFNLLNYEKLFIVTSIDYDKLNLINFDTKTIITHITQNETKTYNGKIINFGYEVKDGKVDVQIYSDEKFLPGTPLKITFEIVNQTESLYILKQMLLMDGDIYYVEVENEDGQRTRRDVEIGDFFETFSNNEKIEYVEIRDGLQLGERLIVDIIE